MIIEKDQIFSQISIYSKEIEGWEEQISKNTVRPGETDLIKGYIKKNKLLIDTLLDRYNKQKKMVVLT
jgi:hypothetical protein